MSILCVCAEEPDCSGELSIEKLFAELLLSYATDAKEDTRNRWCGCGCECGCEREWHRPSMELLRRASEHYDKNDSDGRSRPIEEKKATHGVDADGDAPATATATATASVVISVVK